MACANGSPEICISTDAMKWSRVTKVVSTAEMSTRSVCTGSNDEFVWVANGEEGTVDEPHPIGITRDAKVILKTTFIIYA
jgi:hypothetical protein